jgi:hypothetical protein
MVCLVRVRVCNIRGERWGEIFGSTPTGALPNLLNVLLECKI